MWRPEDAAPGRRSLQIRRVDCGDSRKALEVAAVKGQQLCYSVHRGRLFERRAYSSLKRYCVGDSDGSILCVLSGVFPLQAKVTAEVAEERRGRLEQRHTVTPLPNCARRAVFL